MTNRIEHQILNYFIASVWLANGLFCKVLNLVPRHRLIVAKILGDEYSQILTFAIGCSEIVMAIWVLSNFRSKLNAIIQIVIIAAMNTIEFFVASDMLLWGKANAIFAFLLILIVYFNEFYLNKKTAQ